MVGMTSEEPGFVILTAKHVSSTTTKSETKAMLMTPVRLHLSFADLTGFIYPD